MSSAVAPPPFTKASSPLETTPIKDLQTGMRVIGDNPELADQIIEPLQIENPEEWRNVRLEMIKADDSQLLITLLRPMEWLEFHEANVGSVIELDLAELGAAGPARIIAIDPCPTIEPGSRPLITGTFEHTAANVIDLSVESEAEPIGTTDNHPFWSQDRQKFVEAGDLKVGEQLSLADGRITRVTSIIPRAGPETVYNLEISGEHVYHVGNTGVLVHNSCVSLYRVVNADELASIKSTGTFTVAPGKLNVKQFHLTRSHALEQAKIGLRLGDSSGRFLLRVKVPKNVFRSLDRTPLDGMPAATVQPEMLKSFNRSIRSLKIWERFTPVRGPQ